MKKKQFAWLLAGVIVMIVFTFTLQSVFYDQTTRFNISCGAFFLSIFCLFNYKNALKPTGAFGPKNATKKYYENRGELPQYQKICKMLFIITISVGILCLIYGLGELFIKFLRSVYAN